MDKKKIVSVIGVIAGLAVVIVALTKGACTGMINTAAGGAVPMKCHWSIRVCTMLGVLLAGVCTFELRLKSKEAVIVSAVVGLALSVCVFLTLGPVIGVCGKEDMLCRSTAPIIKIAAAVGGASQLLLLVFSRDSKPSKTF